MTTPERFTPGTHDKLPHIVDNETGKWALFTSEETRDGSLRSLVDGTSIDEVYFWLTPERARVLC